MNKAAFAVALSALLLAVPAWGVNKCTDANGRVTYQEAECPGGGEKLKIQPKDETTQAYRGTSVSSVGAGRGVVAQPSTKGSVRRTTGSSATVHTGPRGGRYVITESGNKRYLPRNKR